MNTEPSSFKDISIKGIFLALVIFTTAMGAMALAVYHFPTKINLIRDLTLSFLFSIAFMVVLNSRGKSIRSGVNTTGKIRKNYQNFILIALVIWVALFILMSIIKL